MLCLSVSLNGQQLNYRHFTMEHGLSQMKINSLVCDSIGNIWIGTRNGLNKFNGESFTIYNTSDGLLHERIHQVGLNNDQMLVALTYNGISIFDGASFMNFPKEFIFVLYEMKIDHLNNVWIYERSQKKLIYLSKGQYHDFDSAKIEGGQVMGISSDNNQKIVYVGATNGVYRIGWSDTLTVTKINNTPITHSDPSSHLEGLPLFSTTDSENFKIGQVLVNNIFYPGYKIKKKDKPLTVEFEKNNNLWVKYFSYVALPFYGSGKLTDEFTQVNSVIKDLQGQIWLGTEIGLIQLFSNQFQNQSYDQFPYVWSVIEDNDHNIWTTSFGKGIYFYKDGIDPIPIHSDVFENNLFLAASEKNLKGDLYFGHSSNLVKWNGMEFSVIHNESTFALAYDTSQNRLVAGVENGIFIIEKDEVVDTIDHSKGMHYCHYIQSLAIDQYHNYWAGSYTGLSKYNALNGHVTNYTLLDSSLLSTGIYDIHIDEEGNIWLGGESGLIYYDKSNDNFVLLKSELLNTLVKSIISLDKKYLLIGAKDGLYVLDKKRFLEKDEIWFQIFNNSNGYNGIEPGFSGLYKDSNEKIWITSATDLITMEAKNFTPKDQTLRSQIIKINEKPVRFNHTDLIIDTFYKEDIKVDFEAVGTIRPATLKYQYKLNDEDWSSWSEDNSVVFNNLNSGSYSFKVRAGPSDGPVSLEKIDKIQFNVVVPFYRSNWFPIIAISFLLVAIITSFYFLFKSRLEHKKYLSRTKEANQLKSQLLLAELNPHFIFNVLASIQSKILKNKKKEASEYIVRLSNLIRNFLEASHNSNASLTDFNEQDILLPKEMELIESYIIFERDKSNEYFDYKIKIDQDLDTENTFIPPMLIQPFVENAIKHGLLPARKKGMLEVEIKNLQNGVQFLIKDNGIGINQKRKNLFQPHKSLGSKIINERIKLLNDIGYNINLNIEETITGGTKVTLSILDDS